MSVNVVGFGKAALSDIESLLLRPEYRKASPKMMLVSVAIEKALEMLPASNEQEPNQNIGFILTTGFGEIEATAEFLKVLSITKVARPVLFQNSLHNSTTGFAAIRFGIQGPVLTMNHRTFGSEQALDTAKTFIQDGECEVVLVVSVETVLKEFAQIEPPGLQGASAVVVASETWTKQNKSNAIATLEEIETHQKLEVEQGPASLAFKSLYEMDALHQIVQKLETGLLHGSQRIEKAPFGYSVLSWL